MIEHYQIEALAIDPRLKWVLGQRVAGKKLEEIAQTMGITRERVRQLQGMGLRDVMDDNLRSQILAAIQLPPKKVVKLAEREAYKARMRMKYRLKESLASGFRRREILEILEADTDPEFTALTNIQLCDWLHDEFGITRFGDYIYCIICHSPRPNADFSQGTVDGISSIRVCRPCGSKRQNKFYQSHKVELLAYARSRKNRGAIYSARNWYKKQGKPELMPPLPPKGIPGDIPADFVRKFVPGFGQGAPGFKKWWATATQEQITERNRKSAASRARNRQIAAGV